MPENENRDGYLTALSSSGFLCVAGHEINYLTDTVVGGPYGHPCEQGCPPSSSSSSSDGLCPLLPDHFEAPAMPGFGTLTGFNSGGPVLFSRISGGIWRSEFEIVKDGNSCTSGNPGVGPPEDGVCCQPTPCSIPVTADFQCKSGILVGEADIGGFKGSVSGLGTMTVVAGKLTLPGFQIQDPTERELNDYKISCDGVVSVVNGGGVFDADCGCPKEYPCDPPPKLPPPWQPKAVIPKVNMDGGAFNIIAADGLSGSSGTSGCTGCGEFVAEPVVVDEGTGQSYPNTVSFSCPGGAVTSLGENRYRVVVCTEQQDGTVTVEATATYGDASTQAEWTGTVVPCGSSSSSSQTSSSSSSIDCEVPCEELGFPSFQGGGKCFKRMKIYDGDTCLLPPGGDWEIDGYYIVERQGDQCVVVESNNWYAVNGYGVGAVIACPDPYPVVNTRPNAPINSETKKSLSYENPGDPCGNETGDKMYAELSEEIDLSQETGLCKEMFGCDSENGCGSLGYYYPGLEPEGSHKDQGCGGVCVPRWKCDISLGTTYLGYSDNKGFPTSETTDCQLRYPCDATWGAAFALGYFTDADAPKGSLLDGEKSVCVQRWTQCGPDADSTFIGFSAKTEYPTEYVEGCKLQGWTGCDPATGSKEFWSTDAEPPPGILPSQVAGCEQRWTECDPATGSTSFWSSDAEVLAASPTSKVSDCERRYECNSQTGLGSNDLGFFTDAGAPEGSVTEGEKSNCKQRWTQCGPDADSTPIGFSANVSLPEQEVPNCKQVWYSTCYVDAGDGPIFTTNWTLFPKFYQDSPIEDCRERYECDAGSGPKSLGYYTDAYAEGSGWLAEPEDCKLQGYTDCDPETGSKEFWSTDAEPPTGILPAPVAGCVERSNCDALTGPEDLGFFTDAGAPEGSVPKSKIADCVPRWSDCDPSSGSSAVGYSMNTDFSDSELVDCVERWQGCSYLTGPVKVGYSMDTSISTSKDPNCVLGSTGCVQNGVLRPDVSSSQYVGCWAQYSTDWPEDAPKDCSPDCVPRWTLCDPSTGSVPLPGGFNIPVGYSEDTSLPTSQVPNCVQRWTNCDNEGKSTPVGYSTDTSLPESPQECA